MMKRYLAILALLGAALVCTACPPAQRKPQPDAIARPASPYMSVCLVRTDLGLADGAFSREADAALTELAAGGVITYQAVGDPAKEQDLEGGADDIALPDAFSKEPGSMTLNQALKVLALAAPCDLLVLSSPLLAGPALAAAKGGKLKAKAVLVLDEDGLKNKPAPGAVPVYYVRYDIRPAAFIGGVVAAASSRTSMFVLLGNDGDPQAEEFLAATEKGIRSHTPNSTIRSAVLPVDSDGLVDPETFRKTRDKILKEAGPYFTCDHYIVALGRTTPTVMYSLAEKPVRAYLAGGYADFRSVRPQRILCCALKHPGAALKSLFAKPALKGGVAALGPLCPEGLYQVGLAEEAVGYSGFEMYKRYNPDGEDLEKEALSNWEEIKVGEQSDYPY